MARIDPYIYLIVSLLGVAYPILLQVVARHDERYESEHITSLSKSEIEWTAFRYTLVAALMSVLIWSLKLQPVLEIDRLDFIIENSATLLVALSTIVLVISFLLYVRKVLIYYTPYSLIPYLIRSQEKSKSEVKYFSALSDLLLLSIKRQQTNLSRTLSDFFYTAFRKVRDGFSDEPVLYPEIYYETVTRAVEELAILKEKRNYLLEHRTAGGIWLIGEMHGKEISERTYTCLWRNLILAIRYQQDDLVVNHWETCSQYYSFNLPYIYPEYDNSANSIQVSNQEVVNKRLKEQQRFLEFHYALGGLLTYKERYACIGRLFNHTQSEPPKYELLPESMYEIFKFYFEIRDPYERKYPWISNTYPFPELSGLNADYVIKKWIMSYMAILFLRQYTIFPYLLTMKPLDYPPTPNSQGEIKEWIDGLDFFKKLVNEHLQNHNLLKTLNLDFITPEWCHENQKPYPITFIETFKTNLEEAYHSNSLTLPLSDNKISQFRESTRSIIESAIERFQPVNNAKPIQDENPDKWYVNGQRMLQSRDAFIEDSEVHHLNFDTFLATAVSRRLNDGFGDMLLRKASRSYLIKPEEFFKAIGKLDIDESFVIINFGVYLDYFMNQLHVSELSQEKYKDTGIFSFNSTYLVRDSLFILRKSDLPNISTIPIAEEIITKYSLEKISANINLYASVIDLNETSEEIFNENRHGISDEEVRKSVLLSIVLSTEFKWSKNIEVIQLRQHSDFDQKGVANRLDDVKPFGMEKPGS